MARRDVRNVSTKDLQANSNALRVCPFCGGEAKAFQHGDVGYVVQCRRCGIWNAGYNAAWSHITDDEFNGFIDEESAVAAWNARAERTCQFTIKDNMNESEGMGDVWIECSACHCAFDFYADEWLMNMGYCPNCGARVIGKEVGE